MGLKRICSIVFWLLTYHLMHAQTNTPKYSNEFLAIGVDARALGMAGAYTSVSADISSSYWNPSALNNIPNQFDLGLMHAQYFAGIANYDYAGFATRMDSVSTLAISAIRFGIDDIPDTRFLYDANGALNYDNIRFFSAADYGFFFSYARKLNLLGGIDVGGSAKIIYRSAGNFATAWGYGIDLAATKRLGTLTMALMLRDITGTYNTWYHNTELVADIYTQTGNDIPENTLEITLPRAIAGISYLLSIGDRFSVLTSLDLETTFDGQRNTIIKGDPVSIDPRLGIEIGYLGKAYLRGGIGQIQEIQNFDRSYSYIFQPNFGVGINIKSIRVDYALTDIGDQTVSPYSHVVSLKYGFDAKK
jgi:hypothetical protein